MHIVERVCAIKNYVNSPPVREGKASKKKREQREQQKTRTGEQAPAGEHRTDREQDKEQQWGAANVRTMFTQSRKTEDRTSSAQKRTFDISSELCARRAEDPIRVSLILRAPVLIIKSLFALRFSNGYSWGVLFTLVQIVSGTHGNVMPSVGRDIRSALVSVLFCRSVRIAALLASRSKLAGALVLVVITIIGLRSISTPGEKRCGCVDFLHAQINSIR